MYIKIRLPDNFVKGDCEHCPLHTNIVTDEWYDSQECHILHKNTYGNASNPQENCPMEIESETLKEKINIYKDKTGYNKMTKNKRIEITQKSIDTMNNDLKKNGFDSKDFWNHYCYS
jgi:hypothetical protein